METLVAELQKRGFQLLFLSHQQKGSLHDHFERSGIPSFASPVKSSGGMLFYLKQMVFLLKFIKHHQVDVVMSHLQTANIISVLSSIFTSSRFLYFRHHDLAKNLKEKLADKLIYTIADELLVPSSGVKQLMMEKEKCAPDKIKIMPYVYDFGQYALMGTGDATAIRQKLPCRLMLLMMSRLVPEKDHLTVLQAMKLLLDDAMDVRLHVLDDGPLRASLEQACESMGIIGKVSFLGYQQNIMDHLEAADVLVHPSFSEASCSAVKEAALKEKLVVVRQGVGDFDEYFKHGLNGLVLSGSGGAVELYDLLKDVYDHMDKYLLLGKTLRRDVLQKFSPSESVMGQYIGLFKK